MAEAMEGNKYVRVLGQNDNSLIVRIPKYFSASLGFKKGDEILVSMKGKQIIIEGRK